MWRPTLLSLTLASSLLADGAADLQRALARLPGTTPIKGTLETRRWNRAGDGKETVERGGQASAWVDDGPQGLRVFYDRAQLGRLTQESRAQRKDPDAKTPATQGLGAISAKLVAEVVNAAEGLAAQLDQAQVQSEVRENWRGKSARKITYELTIKNVNGRDKKYVKEFTGSIQVWIDEEGTPLAATTKSKLKGRAFLVVSFHQDLEQTNVYQRVGDRLVCVREELNSQGAGAGEKGHTQNTTTFTVQ
jgi:hypothetical protein